MSDKKPPPEEAGDAPPPQKKKLLLFIIIGVLVLVLGGGGAFMMLKKKPAEDGEDEDEAPAKSQAAPKKKAGDKAALPVFVKLDSFTVKLQTEQQESYLQTTPELRVYDALVADKVKAYNPEIRHKTMLILMSRKASELGNPQGVQKLANELRFAINTIIDGPKVVKKKKGSKKSKEPAEEEPTEIPERADPDDSVQAVLLTQFIIQ